MGGGGRATETDPCAPRMAEESEEGQADVLPMGNRLHTAASAVR